MQYKLLACLLTYLSMKKNAAWDGCMCVCCRRLCTVALTNVLHRTNDQQHRVMMTVMMMMMTTMQIASLTRDSSYEQQRMLTAAVSSAQLSSVELLLIIILTCYCTVWSFTVQLIMSCSRVLHCKSTSWLHTQGPADVKWFIPRWLVWLSRQANHLCITGWTVVQALC